MTKLLDENEDRSEDELKDLNLILGRFHYNRGKLLIAEKHYESAKSYFTETKENTRLAEAYVGLATVYAADARHEDAIINAEKALAITTEQFIIAEANLRLGICYRRMSDFTKAEEVLSESLKTSQSDKNTVLTAEILIAIGDIYWGTRDWEKAENYYNQSIDILKPVLETNPEHELAKFHLSQAQFAIGRSYIENNRHDEAKALLNESFQSLEKIERFFGIEMCAQLLGTLYEKMENWEEARHWYSESYLATEITGNEMRKIETLFLMAQLAYNTDMNFRAKSLVKLCISRKERTNFEQRAKLLLLSGNIYSNTPYPEKAIEAYKDAILYAVQGDYSAVQEVFFRLTSKFKTISRKGNKSLAIRISRELVEWWSTAKINEKKATDFERDQSWNVKNNSSPLSDRLPVSTYLEKLLRTVIELD